jgi:hypothetical protein
LQWKRIIRQAFLLFLECALRIAFQASCCSLYGNNQSRERSSIGTEGGGFKNPAGCRKNAAFEDAVARRREANVLGEQKLLSSQLRLCKR